MPTDPARVSLWPFAALSASYFAHVGFFNPYLPLWLQDLGLGLLAIGVLSALQSATRLFAPYLWAWISDHTGHRVWLLRYCASAALLTSLWLGQAWGVVGLFVVLLLMFTHTSAMMPLSETVLAQQVSRSGHFDARRYGRVRVWGSLGFLVTVLAAGAWFERHGMGGFPIWTVFTLLAVVLSVWLMPAVQESPHAHAPTEGVWRILQSPPVRWFFVSVFLHVLTHLFVYIFFSLYLHGLGYSKTVIGLLWAFGVVVEVVWFVTQGRWLPLLGLSGWLRLAGALLVCRMLLTAGLADGLVWLFLAQGLHALTFAAHHSVCITRISQWFPGRTQARGQALYSVIGYGLSGVVAGLVGGWVSSVWGLSAVFWLAVGTAVLATWAAGVSARAS
jgi:MFS transporter, PPP family, 3-phenylpropionic acid transporter